LQFVLTLGAMMKTFWARLVIQSSIKNNQLKRASDGNLTSYAFAKSYRAYLVSVKHLFTDALYIITGIFSAAFGLKGFLIENNFIDGGVTGISLLASALTKIPLYQLIIGINTGIAILGLSICLALVTFPHITHDKLLVAVFGGIFLGAGIGFSVRGGAVIDGTEVLAIYLSRKFGTTIGDIIIIINVFIFSAAAYFLSIEIALYSMITYLSVSKTLDFIIEGIDEYTGVTIISSKSEEIRQMIITKMGRGVTVYSGKRGYGKRGETKEVDIIYTVITRLELNKLNTEIEKIEPNAFVVMNSVKDTKGGIVKKRPLKHA
jgi:uncharacterized membrane-anchored protein YitT (DUF2179 family)